MPKIFFLTGNFKSDSPAAILCSALRQQGNDVHIVTDASPQVNPQFGPIPVHKIFSHWSFTDLPRFVNLAREKKPDVIHLHLPLHTAEKSDADLVPWIGALLREMGEFISGATFVVSLDAFWKMSLKDKIKLLPVLLQAQACLVNQPRDYQVLKKLYPRALLPRLHFVPEPVKFFGNSDGKNQSVLVKNIKAGLDSLETPLVVGYAGEPHRTSFFISWLEAALAVFRRNPNFRFIAVSNLSRKPKLPRLGERRKLDSIEQRASERVFFTELHHLSDTAELLKKCDVVCFGDQPIEENFSDAFKIALSLGLPVIARTKNRPLLEELGFRDKENIWLIEDKKIFGESFTRTLRKVLERNQTEKQNQIPETVAFAENLLGIDTVTNQINRIYLSAQSTALRESMT